MITHHVIYLPPCFLFYAYINSRHIGNLTSTKMKKKNEKKVVAKVVDFLDFHI